MSTRQCNSVGLAMPSELAILLDDASKSWNKSEVPSCFMHSPAAIHGTHVISGATKPSKQVFFVDVLD